MASCVVMRHLIAALRGWAEFKTGDHSMLLWDIHEEIRCCHIQDTHNSLEGDMEAAPSLDYCWLRCGTKKGMCLAVLMSMVNIAELGDQYCLDTIFLHYGIEPPDLPTHCDGCNTKFTIFNSLDCKKNDLIRTHHNELHDGVA